MIQDRDDEFWALVEQIELQPDIERCVRFSWDDFVTDLPILIAIVISAAVVVWLS